MDPNRTASLLGETASLIGSVLGGTYKVEQLLGEGGMGAVYTCQNVRLGKRFAVKVLSGMAMCDPGIVHRFQREARIATELGHPHIIEVQDFNQTPDGMPYMVMERLSGSDLEATLTGGVALAPARAVFVLRQVCSALHGAHAKGIVHRDLKPGNIFLCDDREYADFVKVLDFGISKILGSSSLMTQDASIFGTPNFMAPEQAQGRVKLIGPTTDVFALGAILYRMLGGKLPFVATDGPSGLLYQVVHEQPPPLLGLKPELPPRLVQIVERAMAKDQAERYQSVHALSSDLLDVVPEGLGPLKGTPWEQAEPATVDALGETQVRGETEPPGGGPPSTLSSAASEVSGSSGGRPTGRWIAFVLGGLVIAALALSGPLYYVSSRSDAPDGPATSAAAGQPPGAPRDAAALRRPVATARADGGAAEGPARVVIRLKGRPKGAEVLDASTRAPLTTLPGEFTWPASSAPLRLLIRHRGFKRKIITVIPTEDREPAPIRLRPRRRSSGAIPVNPHTR